MDILCDYFRGNGCCDDDPKIQKTQGSVLTK